VAFSRRTIRAPVVESEAQLKALLTSLSGVDAVGAEARAAKLATRSHQEVDEAGRPRSGDFDG
jgi:hypothetical protein